jgi:hypothetical protein
MPAGTPVWSTQASAAREALNSYESIDMLSAIPLLQQNADNTIAVEVHQRSTQDIDLVMDLELVNTYTAPVLTRGPYVQNASHSAMSVRWRTDIASPTRVRYGTSRAAMTSVAENPAALTEHEIRLTGLDPDTRYYYSIGDFKTTLAGDDDTTHFHTNPTPGDQTLTRVWAIGDAGWNSVAQRNVRAAFENWVAGRDTTRDPDLWLMLGDNAYNSGTDGEFQNAVFNMYRGALRRSCVWTTRGNHDLLYGGTQDDYYEFFTMPTVAEAGGLPSGTEAYYSFDFGDIHFICLDSEGTNLLSNSPMWTWLRADVAATNRTWVVAFWHHPPYTHGSHNSDNEGDSGARMGNMRRNALPILDSTGVDLVLTGHSHSYERSFLLNGHYGTSGTLAPSMIVDGGNGRIDGDGAYTKPTAGTGPFEGAVYVVAGSSGITSGGTLDHPVMVRSANQLGSLVLEVRGRKLDAYFVDSVGVARDSFRIVKGSDVLDSPPPRAPRSLTLALASASPSRGTIHFSLQLPSADRAQLDIMDAAGRRVARAADRSFTAGAHVLAWNGRTAGGSAAAPGVYFAVLSSGGERRAVKFVLAR